MDVDLKRNIKYLKMAKPYREGESFDKINTGFKLQREFSHRFPSRHTRFPYAV